MGGFNWEERREASTYRLYLELNFLENVLSDANVTCPACDLRVVKRLRRRWHNSRT